MTDELTAVYMVGLHDGRKSSQRKWVGLDEHDFDVLFLNEDGIRFAKYIEAKLKEKND